MPLVSGAFLKVCIQYTYRQKESQSLHLLSVHPAFFTMADLSLPRPSLYLHKSWPEQVLASMLTSRHGFLRPLGADDALHGLQAREREGLTSQEVEVVFPWLAQAIDTGFLPDEGDRQAFLAVVCIDTRRYVT